MQKQKQKKQNPLHWKNPLQFTVMRKEDNNKCGPGCREIGTLVYCWWEGRMVQPPWETICWFLGKLNIELPHDPAIPLLIIDPKNWKWGIHSSTVHSHQKSKELKCPSTDAWINEFRYIHMMDYYSATKRMRCWYMHNMYDPQKQCAK